MHQSTMVASHSRFRSEGGCCCKTLIRIASTSLPRVALTALFTGSALGAAQTPAAQTDATQTDAAPTPQTPVRLLPAPREAHFGETTQLPDKILVVVPGHDAEDEFAARDLEDALKRVDACRGPSRTPRNRRIASRFCATTPTQRRPASRPTISPSILPWNLKATFS